MYLKRRDNLTVTTWTRAATLWRDGGWLQHGGGGGRTKVVTPSGGDTGGAGKGTYGRVTHPFNGSGMRGPFCIKLFKEKFIF